MCFDGNETFKLELGLHPLLILVELEFLCYESSGVVWWNHRCLENLVWLLWIFFVDAHSKFSLSLLNLMVLLSFCLLCILALIIET